MFCRSVGTERNVGEGLLVSKLVSFRSLEDAIEDQDAAVVGRLQDLDRVVMRRGRRVQDLVDLEGEGLPRP